MTRFMEDFHKPDVQVSDCAELRRYWSDPTYRAACDAEVEANRALCHAAIDRGMAALNAKQAARWAAEEAASDIGGSARV